MLLSIYTEENFHHENLAMCTHVPWVSRVTLELHEDMLGTPHFRGAVSQYHSANKTLKQSTTGDIHPDSAALGTHCSARHCPGAVKCVGTFTRAVKTSGTGAGGVSAGLA